MTEQSIWQVRMFRVHLPKTGHGRIDENDRVDCLARDNIRRPSSRTGHAGIEKDFPVDSLARDNTRRTSSTTPAEYILLGMLEPRKGWSRLTAHDIAPHPPSSKAAVEPLSRTRWSPGL